MIPVEKITIVEFMVFDKRNEHTFLDSTPEQCCKYIWKHIWETAQIKRITEYKVDYIINHSALGINNKLNHGKNKVQ